MHVSIASEKQTSEDGALFQTRGLEFTHQTTPDRLSSTERLALAVLTEDKVNFPEGLAPLGGERRLAHWRTSQQTLPLICPPALRAEILTAQACRVVLLTPAHFEQGYRPTWLLDERQGVRSKLIAIACRRAQVVSGWDFATNKPKPTRRLAPAGAVYFLKLKGNQTAINQWIDEIWLQCVSDDPQMRRDGFGLAALGAWLNPINTKEP
jgi:CRISPR-associated protein Cmr3